MEQIEAWFAAKSDGKPKTFLQNYWQPFRRILETCMEKDNDVFKCLKKSDKVIADIRMKSKNFSTQKVYAQAVLWFIDNYPEVKEKLGKTRDKYMDLWQELKLKVLENPKTYDNLPTIEEVQTKIDEKYGEDSMESLYVSFYKEVPMRLDYKDIKVYGRPQDVPEDQDKYLTYNNRTFVAKTFNKTSKTHEPAEVQLTPNLINKIKKSLIKFPRDQLFIFPNADPSKAIAGMFRKAGLDLTLNSIRHIMADTATTTEEKVKLAKKMKHAPSTSNRYRQQIGRDTETIEIPRGKREEIEQLILDYLELNEID